MKAICDCGHELHEHTTFSGKPSCCTVLACACRVYGSSSTAILDRFIEGGRKAQAAADAAIAAAGFSPTVQPRRPYQAPAITDRCSAPPANDRERVALAEFIRMTLREAPFVLTYVVPQPSGEVRLVTLSNATEPQRLMRRALEETERQALASQGKAPLQ